MYSPPRRGDKVQHLSVFFFFFFFTQTTTSLSSPFYIPVFHAGQLGSGLLQVVVVAVGEGAQAAGDQGHGAEAGSGMAGRVGAGGVLLAVLAVARGLQPVVRTRKGHLHGCWQKATSCSKTNETLFVSLTSLRVF